MLESTFWSDPLLTLKDKLGQSKSKPDEESKEKPSADTKDSKNKPSSGKKVIFRFKKSDFKLLPELLDVVVEQDDKENLENKEKKMKKDIDEVRNQLAGISLKEVSGPVIQRVPMGLSESERDKSGNFDTKFVLKATTLQELKELSGESDQNLNAHYKNLFFNEHIKKKRDEKLNERRKAGKKNLAIFDVKNTQKGDTIYCNDVPLVREFDSKEDEEEEYKYYMVQSNKRGGVSKGSRGTFVMNTETHDMLEQNVDNEDNPYYYGGDSDSEGKKQRYYDGEDRDSNDENNSEYDYPDIERDDSSSERDYEDGYIEQDDEDDKEADNAQRKKFDMEFFERLKRQK